MKILIIDSDKRLAKAITRGIDPNLYEVCYAADGITGHKVTLEKKFDLIVLGSVFPENDVLSVMKNLRGQNKKVPILVAIDNYSLDNILALIGSGANNCVDRASDSKVMIAMMNALLRRTRWDGSADIIYDRIRVDPVTHKVWNSEKEIQLTSKEYSLLVYFIKNTGQVVTRSMIAENAWDSAVNTFTNIIDVYVTYLRRKIDLGANNKLIHTVRGTGYLFSETF